MIAARPIRSAPFADRCPKLWAGLALALLGAVFAPAAQALEFHSVAANGTVLYDAPSLKASPLYIVSRYYPVEVVVSLEGWDKVRDVSGELAWVEKKQLSDTRTVIVTVPLADIRQAPDAGSPVLFRAERNVALEFLETTGTGWVKVKHRDGQIGYVLVTQVWGA